MLMLELVVKDESLSGVAEELNRRGYRNREGQAWTAGQVFDLLPRLIDTGPRILTNGEYIARKHSAGTH
jgi:Recombinase